VQAHRCQRAGEHRSCRESKGAGNQRFRPAHGTEGEKGAGKQCNLPEGDGHEHGGMGNKNAGERDCRREERR
jgi:hypothetical protein